MWKAERWADCTARLVMMAMIGGVCALPFDTASIALASFVHQPPFRCLLITPSLPLPLRFAEALSSALDSHSYTFESEPYMTDITLHISCIIPRNGFFKNRCMSRGGNSVGIGSERNIIDGNMTWG